MNYFERLAADRVARDFPYFDPQEGRKQEEYQNFIDMIKRHEKTFEFWNDHPDSK